MWWIYRECDTTRLGAEYSLNYSTTESTNVNLLSMRVADRGTLSGSISDGPVRMAGWVYKISRKSHIK
jgi:hypothetical protein